MGNLVKVYLPITSTVPVSSPFPYRTVLSPHPLNKWIPNVVWLKVRLVLTSRNKSRILRLQRRHRIPHPPHDPRPRPLRNPRRHHRSLLIRLSYDGYDVRQSPSELEESNGVPLYVSFSFLTPQPYPFHPSPDPCALSRTFNVHSEEESDSASAASAAS
jgi:hypothetical protein